MKEALIQQLIQKQQELLALVVPLLYPQKWPANKEGITEIPYTFNPDAAVKRLQNGDRFSDGEASYRITAKNSTLLQTPPDYLQRLSERSLRQWQEASEGKIVFKRVENLKDGKGIVIAACGTYESMGKHTFTVLRDKNNVMEFSLACFPGDYHSAILGSSGEGAHNYVKWTALHELGHALGLKHPHDDPKYTSTMLKRGMEGCAASVMAYAPISCQPYIDCQKQAKGGWECYELDTNQIGYLDKAAIKIKYSENPPENKPTAAKPETTLTSAATNGFGVGFAKGFAVRMIEKTTGCSEEESKFICEGVIAASIATASLPTALTYMAVTNLPRAFNCLAESVGAQNGYMPYVLKASKTISSMSGWVQWASSFSNTGIAGTLTQAASAFAGDVIGDKTAKYAAEKLGYKGRDVSINMPKSL
jgi:hypothetical protein